jgi:phosphatidylserine/phosphatidylglycerophosphate/cardiolipin synthase-like enzyme
MKILDPSKNITSIISLIENAKKFVVIVSPYTNLEGWDKLKNAINDAVKRGVSISYYVRKGEGVEGTEGLDATIYEVPMLHAKMFFSESEAIISSFHLMNNKDVNWAYALDSPGEYNELVSFFDTHIKPLPKGLH